MTDTPTWAADRLLHAVQHVECGVVLVGVDERVQFVNAEFCRIFGVDDPPPAWTGRPAAQLHDVVSATLRDTAGYLETVETLRNSRHERTDDLVVRDGRVVERNHLPIVDDDGHHGHLCLFWEVTLDRLAEAERERRQRAEIVAQRMGVQAHLQRAQEAEQRAGQRKDALATASHELRTPLIAILSFSELLGQQGVDATTPEDTEKVAQYADIINRNAQRLIGVVDDLLQVTRAETVLGGVDVSRVDVAHLVSQTVDEISPLAAGRSVAIDTNVAPGLSVDGNRTALARALSNVVSNAVKYSDDGGRVVVTASQDGVGVRIMVRDTGIGIPEDELEHVFGQFFRASTARRSGRSGTGLGLSIVRGIMHQHGGSVALRSAVGVGTTVILTLPNDPD